MFRRSVQLVASQKTLHASKVWSLWPFTGQAHLAARAAFCAVASSATESDLAVFSQWLEVW